MDHAMVLLMTAFLATAEPPVVHADCGNTKKSDHFDGRRFFNPTQPRRRSFRDYLKLIVDRRPEAWPKKVENKPNLKLSESLDDAEVAVTFVNHATVLIQFHGYNILTDPVWSKRVSPVSFVGPKRVREPGVPFELLPKIDVVVVSHNHYDHMDSDTLRQLIKRDQPLILVPLGDQKTIEKFGSKSVHEMDWWEKKKVSDDLEITFTPTQHFSGRSLFTFNKSLWGSYFIDFKGTKIYFGGDAAYSSHFAEIEKCFGPMDLSFIPIGAYAPRWFMKLVHMNPEEAVQAHLDLKSKKSVGIHFGTFQLTDEKIDQPKIDLAEALKLKNIDAKSFIVLAEGQTEMFHTDKEIPKTVQSGNLKNSNTELEEK
jgi:L-ascorbate metabolism protein UlaG (beta-lactamase superfamily)